NAPDRRFIDNLLRHHRENLELPLSRQGEQHPAYASEHENLRGEPAEFGKNRTLRFSGHP
ncbi:TPA: hypothetical protein ACYQQP_004609, partial [Escherichia coli]